MSVKEKTLFADILAESKDGEWGKGEAEFGLEKVLIIRGTDFKKLSNPNADFPLRWVKSDLVKRKRLIAGDLILETAGGTSNESTGRSALLKDTFFQNHPDMPILCASFSRFLRLKTKEYNPTYIYYLLQSLHKSGYMAVFNIQHTGVSRFQYTSFKNKTRLDIPEFPVQQKIAAILSAYDDLIENNNKRIGLLEKAAEEIYREWFVRMRFPGWEQVKFVKGAPVDWENTKFKNFCLLKRGYDLPNESVRSGVYPVIASTSIKTYHDTFMAEPPVITTGRSGSLGVVLFTNSRAWPLNTALYVKNYFGNSPYYIYFTLKHLGLEKFNSGAGVPTLNRNHLSGLNIAVPNKNLQKSFDDVIAPIFRNKERLEQINEKLQHSRDLLLPRLISGKLSVEALDIRFRPSMVAQ